MRDMTATVRSLVVGAGGQVGAQILSQLGPALSVPTARIAAAKGWLSLDLSQLEHVAALERELEEISLGAIYCVGGMTNVELCESNADLAMRTNCTGPELLAKMAYERNIPFVYFSTEYVFDGTSGPYREESPGSPISVYGKSKWEGEHAVQAAHPGALIIRTTVVYGPDAGGKNFLAALRQKLSSGDNFRVPADQISTPTYNYDLASTTVGLVQRGATGIFHVCGPERLSRLDFSRRAASFWGLDTELIRGVPTALLGQKAPRPLQAGLDITKLQTLYPEFAMRNLESCLEDWGKRESYKQMSR